MKLHSSNIVSSFFKRSIFSMLFISILGSVSIFYLQQYTFYTSLANEIKINVDEGLKKYNKELKLSSQAMIKDDIKSFMSELGFITIEIYDNEKGEFYSFSPNEKVFDDKLKLLKEYDAQLKHDFPKSGEMNFNIFELSKGQYYLQIFYPLYKSNKLLGYIEGISYVNPVVIDRFKSGIFVTIITIISTIIIFSLSIFPLIYFAYKRLNNNRIVLLSSNIMAIHTLGNAVALRDSDTDEHNYRVTLYSIKLAEKMSLSNEDIKKLIIGAFLHDVGKIGISDNILLKNSKLSEEEFKCMEEHVFKGVELINGNNWLESSRDVILFHHEKYNGKGYPHGLKEKAIPLIARVFAVIDVFDALTSKRPYKEPFSFQKAVDILRENSGTHFDPNILNEFLTIAKEIFMDTNSKSKKQLADELDDYIKEYFLD